MNDSKKERNSTASSDWMLLGLDGINCYASGEYITSDEHANREESEEESQSIPPKKGKSSTKAEDFLLEKP